MRTLPVIIASSISATVGAAEPILECPGRVTDKMPGWRFEASGTKGGETFNPLEGWYPDKGGKLVSPRIPLPVANAYYRISFTASAPERAYEAVAFYDASGAMVADRDGCAERGWGFIDALTPSYRWLYESGLPFQFFSRDRVHSGELGKQIIGRVLLAHLIAGGVCHPPAALGADGSSHGR